MNGHDIFGLIQLVVVMALVVIAAVLATPKRRLPLALRGLMKIMKKDCGDAGREGSARTESVPAWKRILAFILVGLAFMLAMIVV